MTRKKKKSSTTNSGNSLSHSTGSSKISDKSLFSESQDGLFDGSIGSTDLLDKVPTVASLEQINNLDYGAHIAAIFSILDGNKRQIPAKIETINAHVLAMEEIHYQAVKKIAELELQIKAQNCPSPPVPTRSFSAAASAVIQPAIAMQDKPNNPPPTRHMMYVYPNKQDETGKQITSPETTKQIISDTVKKAKLKIGVWKIQKTRDCGVSICCRNSAEIECLTNEIHSQHKHLTCKTPVKKNPVFTFLLPGDAIIEDIPEEIVAQNPTIPPEDKPMLEIVHTRTTKMKNTVITMRVPPSTYRAIKASNLRLFIGCECVTLREQDPTLQCRNCHRFGHKAHNCRFKIADQPATRCYRCSGNHSGSCSAPPKCSNCSDHNHFTGNKRNGTKLDTSHCSTDQNCPLYEKARQNSRLFINYD